MKQKLFILAYMVLVAAVFTSVVAAVHHYTREGVEFNRGLAEKKAILQALHIEPPPRTTPNENADFFTKRVKKLDIRVGEWQQPVFLGLDKAGKPNACAFEISGKGFWDSVKGYIGVTPDGTHVSGIAFFQQSETPGLGAEIAKPWFAAQFRDKPLLQEPGSGDILIAFVAPGSDAGRYNVNAITGATGTSRAIEGFLNRRLKLYLSDPVQKAVAAQIAEAMKAGVSETHD